MHFSVCVYLFPYVSLQQNTIRLHPTYLDSILITLAKTINYTSAEVGSTVFTFPTHAPILPTGNIDVYFVVSNSRWLTKSE